MCKARSVDISGLSEGTYTGSTTDIDPDATNSPQVVMVTLKVNVPALPAALVLSEATGQVQSELQTMIETTDGQFQLTIPAGPLPPQVGGTVVAVSLRLLTRGCTGGGCADSSASVIAEASASSPWSCPGDLNAIACDLGMRYSGRRRRLGRTSWECSRRSYEGWLHQRVIRYPSPESVSSLLL